MEGTSGAAERAPLRGGTRKAALAPVPRERVRRPWVRESGSSVLGRTRTAKSGSVRHARARVPRKRASTTQASPACARHELRREVSEPIGLGRSSHRERSRWEAPSRGKLTLARPLARDISAGRGFGVYVGNRSHPQLNAEIERSWPRERLHRRATAGGSCGVLVVRGRARGSHRLQKSTGGAWPFASGDEEFSTTTMGLACPRESAER